MAETPALELLLVDDDSDFRGTVARRFLRRGYQVREASSGQEGLAELARREYDVVILDLVMPGMGGLEMLEKLTPLRPEAEVIMLTGQGSIESAVQAMKLGAYDYITKPFPLAELELLVEKANEHRQLRKENLQLKTVLQREHPKPSGMIGDSPAMREVHRLIKRAGPTDKAILIQGESGTGKELVARELHLCSNRVDKPLVVINCAALPESLLESELFGHEKGSFTGAINAKPGLFEIADGGTLFIDEIGELAGGLQAKLLRVLEDGTLRRVGSIKERRVNVRLLAATNRKLTQEIQAGRFREDLYYRINVLSLELPPLRERTGDLPKLVEHFLGPEWKIDPAALAALERYSWPGNIRQLSNVLERAKILAENQIVTREDLPSEIAGDAVNADRHPASDQPPTQPPGDDLASIQRSHVLEVLIREKGNKARAARVLGINRRSLYRLLDKYDLP
ncbi:MAG: sigma-54 dependent transcriptional regulator [Pirellulales bacterium]|nr:sigma-54 dependent transcriptional regulator [Pirellulales bacterium]